jgi:hypothetical protein
MQKQRFTRDLDRGNSIQDLTGENAVIDEYIDREAAAPARAAASTPTVARRELSAAWLDFSGASANNK